MKLNTFSRFALAGVLGLALALGAASPASADHNKGRLKDERKAVKQAHKEVKHADNRRERSVAKSDLFNAKQNLHREKFQVHRSDKAAEIARRRARNARFNSARRNLPTPRDVYHARTH